MLQFKPQVLGAAHLKQHIILDKITSDKTLSVYIGVNYTHFYLQNTRKTAKTQTHLCTGFSIAI